MLRLAPFTPKTLRCRSAVSVGLSGRLERRVAGLLLVAGLLSPLNGCAGPQRFNAVPSALAGETRFLQVANARFDADDGSALEAELRKALKLGAASPLDLLALSGGKEDGAFGAGLLVGWTLRGGRPAFRIVTGTSTGALAAPFAFLGSGFDWALESMYTKTQPDDVIARRFIMAAVNSDAMMDSAPLQRMIATYLDGRILELIAAEYEKGRLLLIATTNLDTGKLVIWNIGAIAASAHPRRLELVRKIVLASAALPGMFPPVMLDVLVDESRHQEMHVDGGTVSQIFLYPPSLSLKKLLQPRDRVRATAYIVRNGRISPTPENVERKTLAIAGRAIETMITSNGAGDLYRIYTTTQRDNVGFNLALIERDFQVPYTGVFDTHYMRSLFAYGREKGLNGYNWLKAPPGLAK
ncbi:MAG: patatin-like phospholipase family protein [Hyphomicrobiaceae bacterium]